MLQKNMRAKGYVKTSTLNHLLNSHWYITSLARWRQYLATIIAKSLQHSPYRAMMTAPVVGKKSGLQATQWQVLQRTGTVSVIAGLHIGMVSVGIFNS